MEQRYLALAFINAAEGLREMANIQLQGGTVGADFANPILSFTRAIAALKGTVFAPPPNGTEIQDVGP